MPHSQIGVVPEPAIDRELRRRAYALPGVLDRPTVISVSGARALWLAEEIELLRPEAILRGREFAHIHPDGSLHASLPPQRAQEAIDAGWAEPHPIAAQLGSILLAQGKNWKLCLSLSLIHTLSSLADRSMRLASPAKGAEHHTSAA